MLARFPHRTSLTFVGAVALVLAIANPAAAPPGDLDPTFDGDGKVTTDFQSQRDEAFALAIQPDGKIVAAGIARVQTGDDFALTRYNTDGSLDLTFDGDGKVTTAFAAGVGNEEASAVAIQADGKIVAAGSIGPGQDFALARYNPDGSLDLTFDGDGKVTTDFAGRGDQAESVAIQPDGKIVAAGRAVINFSIDFALARYNTDGSLDNTFDGDGKVITDFNGGFDDAFALAIQGDGKIVAAGRAAIGGGFHDFALTRYNTDGSLDLTFDGDGKVTTDFAAGTNEARAVALQGDGRIVAAGFASIGFSGNYDFAVARYNTNGSLDTSFDGDGKAMTDFADGSNDQAFGVAIHGTGKIVAAGCIGCTGGFDDDFALARYNTDGSVDTTFSGDGKVTTDFAGSSDRARAVATQRDGKIVAAGFATVAGTGQDFALARYTVSMCRRIARASMPICL